MSKMLVTYFSCTNTTKGVAEKLANEIGADLKEIKPEVPYTNADLNWQDRNSRSTIESKDKTTRPAIIKDIENMQDYDVVFVGYPIWWYGAPTIINTFLESYDFSGKTIIPFATSGGSGIGNLEEIKVSSTNSNWKSGKLLNAINSDIIKRWMEELAI